MRPICASTCWLYATSRARHTSRSTTPAPLSSTTPGRREYSHLPSHHHHVPQAVHQASELKTQTDRACRFFFSRTSGSILPGQTKRISVMFTSHNAGLFTEAWRVCTTPQTRAPVVTLVGACRAEDALLPARCDIEAGSIHPSHFNAKPAINQQPYPTLASLPTFIYSITISSLCFSCPPGAARAPAHCSGHACICRCTGRARGSPAATHAHRHHPHHRAAVPHCKPITCICLVADPTSSCDHRPQPTCQQRQIEAFRAVYDEAWIMVPPVLWLKISTDGMCAVAVSGTAGSPRARPRARASGIQSARQGKGKEVSVDRPQLTPSRRLRNRQRRCWKWRISASHHPRGTCP